ncbi:hypothetical protein [Actinomadura rupiterrae]|uniref:hypothetical protein n=1 Tax=Actinomadura rupiterrae TaxID=559627 RepID=UPI0020A5011C|nr:hypothetical protein [Actinomadura rupiterrae]MCP2340808.1 hypothetical protein [Actinomadura rupiterrae]
MGSDACDHVLYADDRDEEAELHLTLECGRPGVATRHDVDADHCAAALDGWLAANRGKALSELLVTTSRVHHGSLRPVASVLAAHRPEVRRLGLGALAFPDFGRGDHIPGDLTRDGSSWTLSVPLEAVFAAVPTVEQLVVQCNDISVNQGALPQMARLQRLVLRDSACDPEVVDALAASAFPRLESLELWLGRFEFGWGRSARDLVPLLNNPGFGALRRLTLVSDLDDALVDVLADSRLIGRLESLSLPFGVFGSSAAARLRDRWSVFGHLRMLDVRGNAIPEDAARALLETEPDVVALGTQRMCLDGARFAPPLVSFFDAWRR